MIDIEKYKKEVLKIVEEDRKYCSSVLNNNKNDKLIQKYFFHPDRLNLDKRKIGLSFILIIRGTTKVNPFLHLVIDEAMKSSDEIICVYNQPVEDTIQFIKIFEKKYPNKFIAYHYEPIVKHWQGNEIKNEPKYSIHTPYAQRQYGYMKSNYNIIAKLDDDLLMLKLPKDYILRTLTRNPYLGLFYIGINIIQAKKKIFLPTKKPFTYVKDTGFWNVQTLGNYLRKKEGMVDTIYPPETESLGVYFIHLKFLKKNYGMLYYDLKNPKNKTAKGREIVKGNLENIKLSSSKDIIREIESQNTPPKHILDTLKNCMDTAMKMESYLTKHSLSDLAYNKFEII